MNLRHFPFPTRSVIHAWGVEMARWMNKLATFMAFAGCVALVENAAAQGAAAPDWVAATKNERGQACEKYAERQEGARLLVACGAAGVWESRDGALTRRNLTTRQ